MTSGSVSIKHIQPSSSCPAAPACRITDIDSAAPFSILAAPSRILLRPLIGLMIYHPAKAACWLNQSRTITSGDLIQWPRDCLFAASHQPIMDSGARCSPTRPAARLGGLTSTHMTSDLTRGFDAHLPEQCQHRQTRLFGTFSIMPAVLTLRINSSARGLQYVP